MKIRDGFVTNSSSTNFIIISKQELTEEFLYKRLGFKANSPFRSLGLQFCEDIINSASLRAFDIDELNYENIKELFGEKTAERYNDLTNKNYKVLVGRTNSDESTFTSFFTYDFFEIDDKDFYINGKDCEW